MHFFPSLENASVATPVGEFMVVASSRGVRSVRWQGERSAGPRQEWASPRDADAGAARDDFDPAAILTAAADQLGEYFAGTRAVFDLPLDPLGTPFQLAAWEVLRGIPFGTTISYGEQARRLGDVRKARAVGAANGRNQIGIIVPCHRVIGGDGSLTGFAAGMEAKAWLLRHEQRVAAR